MATPRTVDVSGLNDASLRTVEHAIAWLRRATAPGTNHHGRYEIVVGESRVKTVHVTWTVAPAEMTV